MQLVEGLNELNVALIPISGEGYYTFEVEASDYNPEHYGIIQYWVWVTRHADAPTDVLIEWYKDGVFVYSNVYDIHWSNPCRVYASSTAMQDGEHTLGVKVAGVYKEITVTWG